MVDTLGNEVVSAMKVLEEYLSYFILGRFWPACAGAQERRSASRNTRRRSEVKCNVLV